MDKRKVLETLVIGSTGLGLIAGLNLTAEFTKDLGYFIQNVATGAYLFSFPIMNNYFENRR